MSVEERRPNPTMPPDPNKPEFRRPDPNMPPRLPDVGEQTGFDMSKLRTDESKPEPAEDDLKDNFLEASKLLRKYLEKIRPEPSDDPVADRLAGPTNPTHDWRFPATPYGGTTLGKTFRDESENLDAIELQRLVESATARLQALSEAFKDAASQIVTTADSNMNNFQRSMLLQTLIKQTQDKFTGLINQFSDPLDSRDSWMGSTRPPVGSDDQIYSSPNFGGYSSNTKTDYQRKYREIDWSKFGLDTKTFQRDTHFPNDFKRMLQGVAEESRDNNSPNELAPEMAGDLKAQIAAAEATLEQLLDQYNQRRNTPASFNDGLNPSAITTRGNLLRIVKDFPPRLT